MDIDATQQLVAAMRVRPRLVWHFLTDFSGDPEEYGDPANDWSAGTDSELGEAFVAMVAELREDAPELMPAFTGIELTDVDLSAIGQEVVRLTAAPAHRLP